MHPLISVVTATRDARHIERCLQSVADQDYPNVEHVIVVDGASELLSRAKQWATLGRNVRIELISCVERKHPINAHIGALYNRGAAHAQGEYLSRIDDDNTVDHNHLSSLHTAISSGPYDAAYSWRKMWHRDGSPYLEERLPWHSGGSHRRPSELYDLWECCQVVSPGSNVYRDTLNRALDDMAVTTVDASEWLWRRDVFLRVKFKERFSYWELLYDASDDDLFSVRFLEGGHRAICTEKPTLNYYLGGHSNASADFSSARAHTFSEVVDYG